MNSTYMTTAPQAPTAPLDTPAPGPRINENVGSFVYDGNEARRVTPASSSVADLRADLARSGSIVSTARTTFGAPVAASQIAPDTIVSVSGIETTVAQAERMGLIAKNPATGLYSDTGIKPEAIVETPKPASVDLGEPLAEDGAEVMLGEVAGTVSATDQARALAGVIESNEVPADIVKRAATAAGVPESEMAQRVKTIMNHFTAQAAVAVIRLGVPDADRFFQWAHSERPNAMQEAMKRHGLERTTAGYKALAEEYVSNLDRFAPELLPRLRLFPGASFAEVNGRTVVRSNGAPEMTLSAAYKHGLIARL